MEPIIRIEFYLTGRSEITVIADDGPARDRALDALTRISPHVQILEGALREPAIEPESTIETPLDN
jgi:hypothetical protein